MHRPRIRSRLGDSTPKHRLYATVGEATASFDCCDTTFRIHADGVRAELACERAKDTALRLERQLDAFDESSQVARLNRSGRVTNAHVARIVRRGLAYYERTGGVFDIHHGTIEHELKAYIRGDSSTVSETFDPSSVAVDGDTVTTDGPLDCNGLAKGYIVDRAHAELSGLGRRGFVDGGGDIARPTGPVGIESPYGTETNLRVLSTPWNVATSGGYRRNRDGREHIYNPKEERTRSHNDLVTVVARRDCMEADALATTLAALRPEDAIRLAEDWDGAEALVVHQGVFHETEGFDEHVR
ncbi:FAD:protein FMN transferase [Haladaptatus sp. T7]|uniref:FAD:protein FMN transferase n=1 Tax=Haladaptatus sp. T7 TaxID=2029368 RepID=UPI0022327FC4|nr:FAD:protein FMN transferase [Haladaptatus sp. T7]